MPFRNRLRSLVVRALAGARPTRSSPATPERILVIRPDHLGDLLLTTPALTHLRGCYPHAHICLLVGPWNSELAGLLDTVDEVQTLAFPFFDRQPKRDPIEPYLRMQREASRLASLNFDTALVMRHDFWWGASLASLAGIPRRVGWGVQEVRPWLTHVAEGPPPEHEAARCLALVEAFAGEVAPSLLPMHIALGQPDLQFAQRWRASAGITGRYAVIHPGSGAAVKLWPAERWGPVADALQAQYGVAVIVTGSSAEATLVGAVQAACSVASPYVLTGVSAGQLAAVLQGAALVLGPDSGVLHLAEAAGTPTVRLFGPASVDRFGPWRPAAGHWVVRSELPCYACGRLDIPAAELPAHPCMRAISEREVLAAVRAAMNTAPVSASL